MGVDDKPVKPKQPTLGIPGVGRTPARPKSKKYSPAEISEFKQRAKTQGYIKRMEQAKKQVDEEQGGLWGPGGKGTAKMVAVPFLVSSLSSVSEAIDMAWSNRNDPYDQRGGPGDPTGKIERRKK
jgi:hypothetical protein